jgi:hypothetical protein
MICGGSQVQFPDREKCFQSKNLISFTEEWRQIEKNNNNTSKSYIFGRWAQTTTQVIPLADGRRQKSKDLLVPSKYLLPWLKLKSNSWYLPTFKIYVKVLYPQPAMRGIDWSRLTIRDLLRSWFRFSCRDRDLSRSWSRFSCWDRDRVKSRRSRLKIRESWDKSWFIPGF